MMQGETQTLRDIYWRFVERKMLIDEAARQITEYTRLYRVEPGSLDLEPMSQEERSKVEELLDYLLQPIWEQFLLGKISMEEAAYREYALTWYHSPFGLSTLTSQEFQPRSKRNLKS